MKIEGLLFDDLADVFDSFLAELAGKSNVRRHAKIGRVARNWASNHGDKRHKKING